MVGFSGSPLARELGLTEGMRLGLDDPPNEFVGLRLLPVPAGITMHTNLRGKMDMVVGFYERRREFERRLPVLRRRIPDDGAIWIAWPRQGSRVPTDITEDVIREVALPAGLVDDKVCAIDEAWAGLRLVLRAEDSD